MLNSISQRQAMMLVFLVTLATISGAWVFEYFGYAPCELCLKQRFAYYAAVPLSLLFLLASQNNPKLLRSGLVLLGLIMLGSCIFGIYHSGVEWKFWQGPTTCTGGGTSRAVCPILPKRR